MKTKEQDKHHYIPKCRREDFPELYLMPGNKKHLDYWQHHSWHDIWGSCTPFEAAAIIAKLLKRGFKKIKVNRIKELPKGKAFVRAWKQVFKSWSLETVLRKIFEKWMPWDVPVPNLQLPKGPPAGFAAHLEAVVV